MNDGFDVAPSKHLIRFHSRVTARALGRMVLQAASARRRRAARLVEPARRQAVCSTPMPFPFQTRHPHRRSCFALPTPGAWRQEVPTEPTPLRDWAVIRRFRRAYRCSWPSCALVWAQVQWSSSPLSAAVAASGLLHSTLARARTCCSTRLHKSPPKDCRCNCVRCVARCVRPRAAPPPGKTRALAKARMIRRLKCDHRSSSILSTPALSEALHSSGKGTSTRGNTAVNLRERRNKQSGSLATDASWWRS